MKVILLVVALLAVLAAAPGNARAAGRDGPGPAVWPLDPRPVVVRPFDPPTSPWGSGHRGVDLLGRPGQAVHSALAGAVVFAGTLAGRGVVVVDHGPTRTTYEPVDPAVAVGDRVATGGVLGSLQTGLSHCAPRSCLHWGLISGSPPTGERYLDPLSLLGIGPVRLLPLAPRPVGPLTLLSTLLRPWGGPVGTPIAAAPP